MIEAVKQCPNLIELHLLYDCSLVYRSLQSSMLHVSRSPVTLRYLRSLLVAVELDMQTLFETLIVPALDELQLTTMTGLDWTWSHLIFGPLRTFHHKNVS
jgi:hypothetical protein